MFIKDGRRFNIHAPYNDGEKEFGIDMTRSVNRLRFGVVEIADPVIPEGVSDETHFITYSDEAPWIHITPRSAESIAEARKARRRERIQSRERESLTDGLVRGMREFMLVLYAERATQLGVTPLQLLDPEHAAYSPAFAQLKKFDDEIAALRKEKV